MDPRHVLPLARPHIPSVETDTLGVEDEDGAELAEIPELDDDWPSQVPYPGWQPVPQ